MTPEAPLLQEFTCLRVCKGCKLEHKLLSVSGADSASYFEPPCSRCGRRLSRVRCDLGPPVLVGTRSLKEHVGQDGTSNPEELEEIEKRLGVVALLDALGTKGVWQRVDPRLVIQAWHRTLNTLEQSSSSVNSRVTRARGRQVSRIMAFSDTILVTLCGAEQVEELIPLMGLVLVPTFISALQSNILLRGAISIGEFHQSEHVLVGPAVDDAANWYNVHDWAGVVLTPNASYTLDRLVLKQKSNLEKMETLDHLYVRYAPPLRKGNSSELWSLAWPNAVFAEGGSMVENPAVKDAIRSCSGL
jgi:hypothetical protein